MPLTRIPKEGEILLFNPGIDNPDYKSCWVKATVRSITDDVLEFHSKTKKGKGKYITSFKLNVYVSREDTRKLGGMVTGYPCAWYEWPNRNFEEYQGLGTSDEEL